MACSSSINAAVNKINAPPVRYLTKSLVRTALKCPRKLVYDSNPNFPKSKSHADDPLLQYLSLEGDRFGDYCKQLFPHGVEIGVSDDSKLENQHTINTTLSTSNVSLDHLVAQTHRTLMGEQEHNKRVTIFEGAIQHGLFYARPDIIDQIYDKESKQIELRVIEVKSKSWDSRYTLEEKMWTKKKTIRSTYLPYIQDIGFQTMVCQLVYPDIKVSSWLMMPDRAKTMKCKNPNILAEDEDPIPTPEDTIQSIDDSIACLLNVDELVETALSADVSYPGCNKDETFRDTVLRWAEKLNDNKFGLDSFSSPMIGMQCSSCEYRVKDPPENMYSGFDICWQEATGLATDDLQNNPLVVDLHANTSKSLKGFISEGKYKISHLTKKDFDLVNGSGTINRSQRQWYQVETIKSTSKNNTNLVHPNYIIQRNHMKQIMENWKYPFHFIDFETMSPAIPYYPNMAPYEVFAFQFSHHTMTNHDGEFQVTHASEFLHTDTETGPPNIAFLKALYNALCLNGNEGTVFQWSPHETTVLKTMLESPEVIAALSAKEMSSLSAILSKGMVDLCKLAQKAYYVDGSEGSSSIKRLLKPTLNASTHLKSIYGSSTYNSVNFSNFQWYQLDDNGCAKDPYDILSDMGNRDQHDSATIAQGGAAAGAYSKLQNDKDLNEADRKDIEASLLRYCELDTLAMVMILQAWQGFLIDDT